MEIAIYHMDMLDDLSILADGCQMVRKAVRCFSRRFKLTQKSDSFTGDH